MNFEAPKKTKVFIARAVIFCMVVFIGAIIIGIVFSKKKTIIKPEQSAAAAITEQNRQADVASQLRASEKGDLLEDNRGQIFAVWANLHGTDLIICDFGKFCAPDNFGSTNPSRSIKDLAKRIVAAYKPHDIEYGEKAYQYFVRRP